MRLRKHLLLAVAIFAIPFFVGFQYTHPVLADEWFDTYPKIDWPTETTRLMRLKAFLEDNSDTVAYIAYQWTDKLDRKDMLKRAKRARNFLIHELKVNRARIIIIDGKRSSQSLTILQPVKKGTPPPFQN